MIVFLREFTAGIRAEADGGHGRRFSGFLAHGVLELKDASDDSAIDAQGGSVDAGGEWADYQCHEVRDPWGRAVAGEWMWAGSCETNSRPTSYGGEIVIHLPDELRDALGAEAGHHGVDRNLGASRQFGEVSGDPEFDGVLVAP